MSIKQRIATAIVLILSFLFVAAVMAAVILQIAI
jgi:hypothetical protein